MAKDKLLCRKCLINYLESYQIILGKTIRTAKLDLCQQEMVEQIKKVFVGKKIDLLLEKTTRGTPVQKKFVHNTKGKLIFVEEIDRT